MEKVIAEEAGKYPGIAWALTRSDILCGRLPIGQQVMLKVTNTLHPLRSGHVHIVAEQHALLMHFPWNQKAGLHGSVWTYDTYVPVMFAGPGVPARRIARPVGPHDIAPTLAAFLGIKPPSGSQGTPLTEVVENLK